MPRSAFAGLVLLLASTASAQQAPLVPADRPLEQVVDHYIAAELKTNKIEPAPLADDATILRRLTLDLVGRIPTLEETSAYLASTAPDKKRQVIDRLMTSPGFVRHQAQEFFTMLQLSDGTGKAPRRTSLHNYLTACFTEKRSWDRIFRELMLPDEADSKKTGAGEFLKSRVKDLNRLTIDTSTLFFGVNVSCAQCHDHPHVQAWTQDHFYGMKAFLARTVESGGFVGEKDFGVVKYVPNKGKEKVAPVMFLTGKQITDPGMREPNKDERKKEQDRLEEAKKSKKVPAPPSFSIRAKLVETALEPGQREFFARSIVNRLWHRLHGRGLVMPLDQMHTENAASHPELLAWLSRDLIDHGYDLQRMIRGLVSSDTYARSSRWDGDNYPMDKFFAVAQARPLTPSQLAVSLKLAASDPQAFVEPNQNTLEAKLLNVENSASRWSSLFPQPGENFQVGVSEAMLFANNEPLLKDLLEGNGTLAARLKSAPYLEQKADLAIRTTLCRPARMEEVQALAEYLRRRSDRLDAAYPQMIWALLTSTEFRFNH